MLAHIGKIDEVLVRVVTGCSQRALEGEYQ